MGSEQLKKLPKLELHCHLERSLAGSLLKNVSTEAYPNMSFQYRRIAEVL